ncbi:hypothetical protein M0R45_036456 [Rubus argutus]|uniref:Uncharacterized protein n=1 Tax=Rubus argutus TaxID=59490 RepID=A0AAW1VYX6_RUBAR
MECPLISTSTRPSGAYRNTFLMVVLNTFEAQPLTDGFGVEGSEFPTTHSCAVPHTVDYLKAPGKSEKDLPSESMKEEIKSYEDTEREKNWGNGGKRDGCPPFEKQPIEKKMVQDGAKKAKFLIIFLSNSPVGQGGDWEKELSQLWKWADQNPNALTDPQRLQTPAITEYWKPLAEDMDPAAGIEAEYHHKNNRVYCWKGLRFSARQDLEGFSKFTEYGIEGVVPLELLPPEERSKYTPKQNDRSKRAKKEETKGAAHQVEENQIATVANEIDGEGLRTDVGACGSIGH